MDKLQVVKAKIEEAYQILISRDLYLFEVDANERSITHKFAEYLQKVFSEWNVDCEYNRNADKVKKVEREPIESDDTDAVTVFPDIIIHHRGTKSNFIIIECKKSTSFSNYNNKDIEKLKAYIEQFKYEYAFQVIFPIGDKLKSYITSSGWIELIDPDNQS
jgi:hypothetical protein